jgi:Ni,Fe-hydrogenase maturation factor
MKRILIGGIGYRNLRDHSFGVVLVDALALQPWPSGVSVEDISYNPIAVVQRLQDEPADQRFDLAILAGVLQRPGREPGTLSVYRWDNALPSAEEIHESVMEAVTGIIAFDNTLIVGRHFNALPDTVIAVELEPEAHGAGDSLTVSAARALADASTLIADLAGDPSAAKRIPVGSLEIGRTRHSGVVFGQVIHGRERVH